MRRNLRGTVVGIMGIKKGAHGADKAAREDVEGSVVNAQHHPEMFAKVRERYGERVDVISFPQFISPGAESVLCTVYKSLFDTV